MSERTERAYAGYDTDAVVEFLQRWYHVPVLSVLAAFMLWVRVQAYDNFITDDGIVMLSAVDSWYHWRTVLYSVENWPFTMPYEVWTGYPTGRYVGQFGTLFDQLIATVAMIAGLGNPSEATVLQVALLSVPVMAALVAIPTYFIGKRLGGRLAGLLGVALLALFPGTFLTRSTVGMLQHHVAEVLFMSIAILAMMVALRVAEREKPVYEQVEDRDFGGVKRPLGYSVLAGVALALYIAVWPPGVVLVGIFGIFFAISLSVDYVRGVSPDHTAFVGTASLGVAGLVALLLVEEWTTSVTSFGYLQPLLALGVAAGCLFMAWLARLWDRRQFETWQYPATVAGLVVLVLGMLALVLPDLFGTVVSNVEQRLFFGQTDTTLTIAEAQPPENPSEHVYGEYRFAFYTAAIGLLALVARPFLGREFRTEYLLVVVWALVVTSMAFTQIRFNYYLAVVVAVCNAYLIGLIVDWAAFSELTSLRNIKGYQVMIVAGLLLVLFVPLLVPAAGATAVQAGGAAGPSGDAITWEGSNAWLADSTPEQGQWGGADEDLEYYGSYEIPEDRDFDYPEGTYGVMSWWDYGHLITVQGERIPHSNPFQQNARSSSAFFLADSEERSDLLLDALPAAGGEDVHERSDEELAALAAEGEEENEELRYVMIDDAMAGGKFPAIATWTGPGYESYLGQQEIGVEDGSATVQGLDESYDETTLSRLYYDDAAEMEGYRLVHESPEQTQFVSIAAQNEEDEWVTIATNRELTPQLYQQLLLYEQQGIEIATFDEREASSVKTYERVKGAQLVGEAEPGETVSVQLELTAQESERTFTYSQETTAGDDGSYELTVPYATNEDLGTADGYTDSDVIAEGDYDITAGEESMTAEVSEEAIYEGETVEVTEIEGTNDDEAEETGGDAEGETRETDESEEEVISNGEDEITDDETVEEETPEGDETEDETATDEAETADDDLEESD